MAVINLYSDRERLNPCSSTGDLADKDKSSEVLDLAFVLLAVFHMIEWIRATILLTVVCIGVNFTLAWFLTIPNSLYGIIAYAITHVVYFSEDGKACGEVQEDRYTWLLIEIILFWITYFLYIWPFFWSWIRGMDREY